MTNYTSHNKKFYFGFLLMVGFFYAASVFAFSPDQAWLSPADYTASLVNIVFAQADQICAAAKQQFAATRTQLDANNKVIQQLQSQCSGNSSDNCKKVSSLSDTFIRMINTMMQTRTDILNAEMMCGNPVKIDINNFQTLLRKIAFDSGSVQSAIVPLQLDQLFQSIVVGNAQKVCSQVLPKPFGDYYAELSKNDSWLRGNLNNCRLGASQCSTLRQEYMPLQPKILDFLNNITKVSGLCARPDANTLSQVNPLIDKIRRTDDLRPKLVDLLVKLGGTNTELEYCRKILPNVLGGKAYIDSGLNYAVNSINSCRGKNDNRCRYVAQSFPFRVEDLKRRVAIPNQGISSLQAYCSQAKFVPISAQFAAMRSAAEQIFSYRTTIDGITISLRQVLGG